MPEQRPVAVVTGGNRGLGLEASRQLAGRGCAVVLTSRDPARGEAARAALAADGLDVEWFPLDVTDDDSIGRLAGHLEERYARVDVLVNNAGVLEDSSSHQGNTPEALRALFHRTMDTNAFGALAVARALAPLLGRGKGGRIVNVSSGMGQLEDMGGGYPAYRLSKTALNAVTRILAEELSAGGISVNSVCPGWVRTDMGGPEAERSVEQGVDTIVWLATLEKELPSGGFFRDRKRIPW